MKLTERQEKLLTFVKHHHGDQKRKYTFEPYWNHVFSVAEIVSEFEPSGLEMALCHDLFEDTMCKKEELHEHLILVGYKEDEANRILSGTLELTDQYTKEGYPDLNRKERKSLESKRLGNISIIAQSVKYADLIDNMSSIVIHDKGFARIYLKEEFEILNEMRKGNINLLVKCCFILQTAINTLDD